jgi:hypothetical protein
MSILEKLPIDAILQITQYLDIEDIIYLHRIDSETAKYFDNKNFLNSLSFQKLGIYVNNFNEMIKLYNYKYVTFHSPKYFSLDECLYKCGAEKNLKYAHFFLEKGATNYDDFLIAACENGNIAAFELSFMKPTVGIFWRKTLRKAIVGATKGGHLEILQKFQYAEILDNFFPDVASLIMIYTHVEIIKWVFEDVLKVFPLDFKDFINKLIQISIDYNNFTILDLILAYSTEDQLYFKDIVDYCVDLAPLQMFKHLFYHHEYGKKFVASTDDETLVTLARHRADVIKFLHISQVIIFDQFQWDIILFHCCRMRGNVDDKDRKVLVEYSLANGSKLYKNVLEFSTFRNYPDLVEHILKQEDIFGHPQSQDYLVKVYRGNRNYNSSSNFLRWTEEDCAGHIDNDYLFLYACKSGNKELLDKTISKGCDNYKLGAYTALRSGHYSISNYLFNKWKETYTN